MDRWSEEKQLVIAADLEREGRDLGREDYKEYAREKILASKYPYTINSKILKSQKRRWLCKSHLYDKQISITELFNIHVYFNETRINSSRIIINWVAFAKQPASPRSEALRNGITFFDSSVVNTHYTVLTHCIVRELQNKRVMLKKRIAKCNSRIINLIETSIVTADLIFLNFSKEKCGPPHPCPFYKIVLSKVKCIKWKLLKINCIKTKEDNNQLQKLGPFSVISTLLMIICLLIVNSEMHFVQLVFPK